MLMDIDWKVQVIILVNIVKGTTFAAYFGIHIPSDITSRRFVKTLGAECTKGFLKVLSTMHYMEITF